MARAHHPGSVARIVPAAPVVTRNSHHRLQKAQQMVGSSVSLERDTPEHEEQRDRLSSLPKSQLQLNQSVSLRTKANRLVRHDDSDFIGPPPSAP
jgi:hypothetical protein